MPTQIINIFDLFKSIRESKTENEILEYLENNIEDIFFCSIGGGWNKNKKNTAILEEEIFELIGNINNSKRDQLKLFLYSILFIRYNYYFKTINKNPSVSIFFRLMINYKSEVEVIKVLKTLVLLKYLNDFKEVDVEEYTEEFKDFKEFYYKSLLPLLKDRNTLKEKYQSIIDCLIKEEYQCANIEISLLSELRYLDPTHKKHYYERIYDICNSNYEEVVEVNRGMKILFETSKMELGLF